MPGNCCGNCYLCEFVNCFLGYPFKPGQDQVERSSLAWVACLSRKPNEYLALKGLVLS